MNIDRGKPLGLIAGGGLLPVLVAAEINKTERTCILAHFQNVDPKTIEESAEHKSFKIGHLGAILDYLKSCDVSEIALAGQIDHSELFRDRDFDALMQEAIQHPDNRAEAVLGRLAAIIEREVCPVASIIEVLASHVVQPGITNEIEMSGRQREDMDFGWQLARSLSQLNIGQTIMVRSGIVVAVEAIEGTDEMIRRTRDYGLHNATVIKMPMDNKDPRFDVPIIGPATIESMHEAGATCLLVAAYETIMIEKERTLERARELGIGIYAREVSYE